MKARSTYLSSTLRFSLAALTLFLSATLRADESTPARAVREAMQRVADWQLAQPSRHRTDDWTHGALYAGVMSLGRLPGGGKYREAMLEMGRRHEWKPGKNVYHADYHCVCQTYLELYLENKDPAMLRPTKERFDEILAQPATVNLHWHNRDAHKRWAWCDALFMSPPAWIRLFRATGDSRYLDFMDAEWRATYAFLYDTSEHLYYRDSGYFHRRETNQKRMFWARGNGWVMAGLARVIGHFPEGDVRKNFYVRQFVEMAERVATLQQEDGLWRAGLLDPDSYPMKETSGSGFFTFALAWGINEGLLECARFEPVVRKGWQGLLSCVDEAGKLRFVQPVGDSPKRFDPESSDVYGVGAFLLAGSEVHRLVNAPR